MTCREARHRLSDYLDASLEARTADALARHLDACASCREEYRLLEATRRLLSTYGAAPCPVDFTYLATRVPVRPRRRRWVGGPWYGPLLFRGLAIAATALTVTFGAWHWRNLSVEPPWPETATSRVVVRDVADVDEMHRSFALQQSMGGRAGLVLYAPDWADRGR